MEILETRVGKSKTLKKSRDKVIDLIFNNPTLYLENKIFEELCNNIEIVDDDVDQVLIGKLCFENFELEEIYFLECEALDGKEKQNIGNTSNKPFKNPEITKPIPSLEIEPSNIEKYSQNKSISENNKQYEEVERIFKVKTKLEN